jgi:hypothetical protein
VKNTFVLTLKATIISYVEVNPDSAYIRAFEGEKGSQTLELKPAQNITFTVRNVELDNPRMKYTMAPPAGTSIARDQSVNFTLESPADLPPGNSSGMIKLATNLADQPEVDIAYTINVQKLISVAPAQVIMNVSLRPYKILAPAAVIALADPIANSVQAGTLETGKDYPVTEMVQGYVQVRFPDGKQGWVELAKVKPYYGGTQNTLWISKHQISSAAAPPPAAPAAAGQAVSPPPGNDPNFKVTGAVSDLAFIKLLVEPKQAGSFLVTIDYDGPMEEKTIPGNITLATNDAREPEIRVPIQITVGKTTQAQQSMRGKGAPPVLKPVASPMTHRSAPKPGEGK